MNYEVRNTQPQDLSWMAMNMRVSDKEEIAAQSGSTPAQSMLYGRLLSSYMKTALVDGVPLLVFGVTGSKDPNIGTVWMLATDYLESPKCRRLLARHSRQWVADMQAMFPILTNKTDKRNTSHHRWLSWCGFVFINETPMGPCRAPFLEFVRI